MNSLEYQQEIYGKIADFLLKHTDTPDSWIRSLQLTPGLLIPDLLGCAHMVALFYPRVLEKRLAMVDPDLLFGQDDGISLVGIPPFFDLDTEDDSTQQLPSSDQGEADGTGENTVDSDEEDELEWPFDGARAFPEDFTNCEPNLWDRVRALQLPDDPEDRPTPEPQDVTEIVNFLNEKRLPHAVLLLLIDEEQDMDMAILYWLAGENVEDIFSTIQRVAAQKIKWLTRYPIEEEE